MTHETHLDTDGLVAAIRSPHGEHVDDRRQESGPRVGQETSDNRRIEVRYRGERPEVITLEGTDPVTHLYEADDWLVTVQGTRDVWAIGYDASGQPAQVKSTRGTLLLEHDGKGRPSPVESGPTAVRVEYLEGTNTLRFAVEGVHPPSGRWGQFPGL